MVQVDRILVSFNPRPHAEGDTLLTDVLALVSMFQSTPSRGGRLINKLNPILSSWFQSTPSRGGRQEMIEYQTN